MGYQGSFRNRNRLDLIDIILGLVSASRVTMDFLLNPEKYNQKSDRHQIQRTLYYLKRKNFIAFPSKTPKGQVILTKLGIRKLNQLKFEGLRIKRTPWDGKWRLLTFDIPEKQSSLRQIFRRKLKGLGFFHFQRSVFIFPFECEKEIVTIASYLKITPCVHLLIANRFVGDKELIKKFNLHVPHF